MQTLKRSNGTRLSRKLNKGGVKFSLTPGIIAWCNDMSKQEGIYRSQFIEESILDCHKSKPVIKGLEQLQDGCGKFLKSNKNRWGEGKKMCQVYLRPTTMEVLQQLSDKTSVSKSECVEYILRTLAEAIPCA